MEARSTLSGVSELAKQLLALGKLEDGKALSAACRAGMAEVLEEARSTVPVGSEPTRLGKNFGRITVPAGYLRDHIKMGTKHFDGQKASAYVGVSKAAYYGLQFVDLGTRYQSPNPWLTRALSSRRSAMESAFTASMQKSVNKAVKAQ
jgi:HK97 gp10 family phage protein